MTLLVAELEAAARGGAVDGPADTQNGNAAGPGRRGGVAGGSSLGDGCWRAQYVVSHSR